MWRAFFLAIGLSMVILGAESLALHKVILIPKKEPQYASEPLLFIHPPQLAERPREVEPPDWAPWSLLGGGTLVMIYSLTLRKQGG